MRATRRKRASSNAAASGCSTRSTAPESRRFSCFRRGRSSTPATGRCRSRTSPGTAACSRSTAAAAGDPAAPPGQRRTPRPSTRTTRSRCWTPPPPSEPCSSRSHVEHSARFSSLPSIPNGWRARSSSLRASLSASHSPSARSAPTRSTTSSQPARAGRSTTAGTGSATTGASWSSSSRRCSTSRTRRSRSRTASVGDWRRRPRRCSTRTTPPASMSRRRASCADSFAARSS